MKVFLETQRFDQWWFKLLILITAAIIISSIFFALPQIENTNSFETGLIIFTCIFSLIIVIAIPFLMKLETKIDDQGIHYAFWPIHLKPRTIPWSDIKECYVRKYNPIQEYGGWGYRIKLGKKDKALNVKGNIGIQIVFKTNRRLLIGTQKENEVQSVLNSYKYKFNKDEN